MQLTCSLILILVAANYTLGAEKDAHTTPASQQELGVTAVGGGDVITVTFANLRIESKGGVSPVEQDDENDRLKFFHMPEYGLVFQAERGQFSFESSNDFSLELSGQKVTMSKLCPGVLLTLDSDKPVSISRKDGGLNVSFSDGPTLRFSESQVAPAANHLTSIHPAANGILNQLLSSPSRYATRGWRRLDQTEGQETGLPQ